MKCPKCKRIMWNRSDGVTCKYLVCPNQKCEYYGIMRERLHDNEIYYR